MTWWNQPRTPFASGTTARPRTRRGSTPRPFPIRPSARCTETDRYWNAIVGNGGQESACGWCKDKWGLSWQITPIALTRAITDPDPAAAKRAFDAMMQMKKIDIAAIEAARRD